MGYYDPPEPEACFACGAEEGDCEDQGWCQMMYAAQAASDAFDYACDSVYVAETRDALAKAEKERASAARARIRAWNRLTTYEMALRMGGHTVPGDDE